MPSKKYELPESEITPKSVFLNRRKFMMGAAVAGVGLAAAAGVDRLVSPGTKVLAGTKLPATPNPNYGKGLKPTSYQDITHYNNFYEFGTSKSDPSENAWRLKTEPWTVEVEGLVHKKKTFDIDQLMKLRPLEDRVYRFRCVEAWSMVIPWVGYSLSELIKACDPLSTARYVQFISVDRPSQEPGIMSVNIPWPYSEGLRMDEAMHPLTLLTLGLYGEALPNQSGAPVRVIVPWKYGFKSAKSIVKIRFVKNQPPTTWNLIAPNEYGFYSNVNPNVDHTPWSQARERVIGAPIWKQLQPTQMFNGYADEVAGLYKGMNLNTYY
uniref:Protein-methionine-sulfoxide reductase catalytic subunit MsrP n=1 Tax=Acidobacterium capsulatum TaxID=33075 RepID=A0A7V4XRP8_9BACT